MIEKEKLLIRLENAIEFEENSISIISPVLKGMLEGAEVSDEVRSRLVEILDVLKRDSVAHRKAIENTLDQVKGDSRDVF
jgi:hypothetical protein